MKDKKKTTKKSVAPTYYDPITNTSSKTPPLSAEENNNLQKEEAIKTLIIGCRLAREKGIYTLEEARTIMNAIDFLNSDKEK